MIFQRSSSTSKIREHSIAQRQQYVFVVPASMMLLVGIAFIHWEYGTSAALKYTFCMMPVLVLATLMGRMMSWRYLLRLNQLRRGAERLEAGQYESLSVVDSDAKDEFSDLARAFNHMVKVIASREAAQREQNMALADLNRRMETVLNATNDGIALLDRDGRFALVNRRFCQILGTRPESLLYKPLSEAQPLLTSRLAKPERLMGRLGPLTEQDLTHPVGVTEEIIEVVAADRRFIQVYTAPVRDDQLSLSGRIIALHDITRETEVDKMKTEFISVVSHELRTPLTAIKGYTDLLLSEQAGEITDLQREFLSILQGSATRLNNLINDILDISRLESGRIEVKMEQVDYEKIVHDVLRLMKAAADEKEISFDASFPPDWPPVRGDADKITQVLSNLVNNAIKYTPRGGWVKVALELSGASITTCVSDSGIGISAEDQKKLFQKFFRADNSTTREAGGTGLGLAIVKTMIELLGGAVWVESEPGEGSSFYFTLPLYGGDLPDSADESLAAPSAPGAENRIDHDEIEAALSRATGSEGRLAPVRESIPGTLLDRGLGLVLIVDDDIYVREHLQHTLHRMGYGVIAAREHNEVLQRARVHRPDVILLDMMVTTPDKSMTGFIIQRALEEDPATASLPVVAYSLVGDPVHGSLSLGAFSFLRKPVRSDQLLASLHSHYGSERDLSLLLVTLFGTTDEESDSDEVKTLREEIAAAGIRFIHARDAAGAVGMAIAEQPDIILLDTDQSAGQERMVFELLRALKSEDDISRIPMILLSRNAAEGVQHFHLGSQDGAELANALDYLSEQVATILGERGVGRAAMPPTEPSIV